MDNTGPVYGNQKFKEVEIFEKKLSYEKLNLY
ncbi:MAG: hypothetical protein K0S26_225 [Bacteroidota bacterium]|jgi:hypothetical protein|nr:hypothetical protein [Bacteroidota bacterium]